MTICKVWSAIPGESQIMLTIGIDVGGTFTDLVAIDAAGRTVFAKALSTPQDQSIGVMAGLDELARRLDLSMSRRCWRRHSGWCTAPRWRPMRCWSARARR